MHPAPPTPADRLSALIVRLVSAMFARREGAHFGFIPGPIIILLSNRLRRVNQRFRRLADRLQAGWVYQPKQTAPRTQAERKADKPPPRPAEPADQPVPSLAKYFIYVRRLPERDMETIRREFRQLLQFDPDMQAVIAAAPGLAWEILRPLYRMIGIPRPDILAPPPRPKAEKPPKAPKPPKKRKPRFASRAEGDYSLGTQWPKGVPRRPLTA